MLDAEKLSLAQRTRAVFPRRHSSGMTVEEPTISGSLMMHEQPRAANVCSTHLVYVAVSHHSLICIPTTTAVIIFDHCLS